MRQSDEGGRVFLNVVLFALLLMVAANLALTYQQTGLLKHISKGVEKPMSTTYHLSATITHTVNTPYREEGLAVQHKKDLCKDFNEGFMPTDMGPFPWYTPGMDCNAIQ